MHVVISASASWRPRPLRSPRLTTSDGLSDWCTDLWRAACGVWLLSESPLLSLGGRDGLVTPLSITAKRTNRGCLWAVCGRGQILREHTYRVIEMSRSVTMMYLWHDAHPWLRPSAAGLFSFGRQVRSCPESLLLRWNPSCPEVSMRQLSSNIPNLDQVAWIISGWSHLNLHEVEEPGHQNRVYQEELLWREHLTPDVTRVHSFINRSHNKRSVGENLVSFSCCFMRRLTN